jgi:hypothetical protein
MIIMRDERSKIVLKALCKDLSPSGKIMVEIGCYSGEATEIFASFFKTVYAVDPWLVGMHLMDGATNPTADFLMEDDVEKMFDITVSKHPNIIKIKDYDYNALKLFDDNSLDFVYIDAIHIEKEVVRQIYSWYPKIKETGSIGGHDFTPGFPEVMRAVNRASGIPDKIYTDAGNSWTKYKKYDV